MFPYAVNCICSWDENRSIYLAEKSISSAFRKAYMYTLIYEMREMRRNLPDLARDALTSLFWSVHMSFRQQINRREFNLTAVLRTFLSLSLHNKLSRTEV